jgi:orotate phosphoribosyltransferase
MSETDLDALLALVEGRRGHFLLESGLHGALWLDLDPLFANAARIAPFVRALARQLGAYRPDAVCGPLVGGAFLAQLVATELHVEFCFTERVIADASAPAPTLFSAQYRLPSSFEARLRGKRVVLVDDVMSAGSSLRATETTLRSVAAEPAAVGALLVLGDVGRDYFAGRGIAVAAVAHAPYEAWAPAACPLCAEGQPLERGGAPASAA